MRLNYIIRLFCYAIIAAILISSCSCSSKIQSIVSHKPVPVVILFDKSLPGFQAREDQFSELDSLAKSSGEANAIFELWSYDSSATLLWGPNPIATVDMIDSIENNKLKAIKHPESRIARPDLALAEFEKSPTSASENGRLYLLTDGAITTSDPLKSLQLSLSSLKSHPGWRVAVLGITPQNQAMWASAIAESDPGNVDLVDSKTAVSLLAQNRDE